MEDRFPANHYGVPENDWTLELPDGVCIDMCLLQRSIGRSSVWISMMYLKEISRDEKTLYLGTSFPDWLAERGLTPDDVTGRKDDLQAAGIFPVVEGVEQMGEVLRWMTSEPELTEGKEIWLNSQRLSADEISAKADL